MIIRERNTNKIVQIVTYLLYTICYVSIRRYDDVVVVAYPSGAAGCFSGDTAVRGIHTSRASVVKNTLSDLNINLKIGGFTYNDNATIPLLQGIEYTISVTAIEPAFFRGILIRLQSLEGQDMTGSLKEGDNTKIASVCIGPELIGLDHYDRTLKTYSSGQFRIDQPGRIRLDISVVIGNEPTLSLYGHDEYLIDVLYTGIAPTTFTPISAPITLAPVTPPVAIVAPAPVPVPVTMSAPIPISNDNRKNQFDVNDL
jgi:hypothetical protein